MDVAQVNTILTRQRDAIGGLLNIRRDDPAFDKWKRDTQIALERIFGTNSRHISDFNSVSFLPSPVFVGMTESDWIQGRARGLGKAEAILGSMLCEVAEYGFPASNAAPTPDRLSLVELLCTRFHAVVRQLQDRHAGRDSISVDDEYDVQDVLHALLKLHFDDVRPEEWTPSYAGGAARVDFLLPEQGIVIEVKKTRQTLKATQLGAELLVDRARYEGHPDCKTLVCFIYDPEARIGNPAGLERDLERYTGTIKVRAIVAPRL